MPVDPVSLDPTKSVRQQIIETIKAAFVAVKDDPEYDDFNAGNGFGSVNIGPLSDPDQRKRYSIGIVPGTSKDTYKMPFVYETVAVDIEYRMTVNTGDNEPGLMAEALLTVVKRVVMSNDTWGGLALQTNLVGDENDLRTYMDKSIVGVLHCAVLHRYSQTDPRSAEASYAE